MTKHKWHKEIKAWADGAEIEGRIKDSKGRNFRWYSIDMPYWTSNLDYRIKPPAECITKDCTNHKNQGTFVKEKNNGTDVG